MAYKRITPDDNILLAADETVGTIFCYRGGRMAIVVENYDGTSIIIEFLGPAGAAEDPQVWIEADLTYTADGVYTSIIPGGLPFRAKCAVAGPTVSAYSCGGA